MTTVPRRLVRIWRAVVPINDRAGENRNVDVNRNVPNKCLQSCRQALLNQRPTDWISDGVQNYATVGVPVRTVLFNRPERGLISLNNFTKSVDDGLDSRVSGRKTV